MICKNCGTEGKGKFCAHCGERLCANGASVSSSPTPISTKPTKKARRLPTVSLKMVFWQSIALLLPLAYLFFDVFVFLSDSLFSHSASGGMNLHRLVQHLLNLSYETNAVGEIVELTVGESVTVFQALSPCFLFSATGAMGISASLALCVAVIAVLALLCAASGVLLLFTGGRILRVRAFCDLTLLFGVGATFAPALGMLLLRLQCCFEVGLAAADARMQHVLPSLEALCIMGILVCVLLPALTSLRRLAAHARGERAFVCFPYRFLTKRSFKFPKIMLLLCMLGLVALVGCFLYMPITTSATGQSAIDSLQGIGKDWEAALAALKTLFAREGDTLAVEAVLRLAGSAWIVFVLLFAILGVLSLLRVLFVRRDSLQKKKRKQRAVKKAAVAIRSTALAPFITFFAVQAILCVVLLFFSPIAMHLNFSNVNETLSVVYLTLAYVRTLGGTNTLYAFLAAGGFLLWHMADGAVSALIVQASKQESA